MPPQTWAALHCSNHPTILVHTLAPDNRPPGIPTNGGKPVGWFEGHESIVYCLAILDDCFDADNRRAVGSTQRLISASEDGTVRVWDITVPTTLRQARAFSETARQIGSAQLSIAADLHALDRDVDREERQDPLALAEERQSAALVDTIIHPPTAATVWSCAALPTGRALISGSSDGVVRVFVLNHREFDQPAAS